MHAMPSHCGMMYMVGAALRRPLYRCRICGGHSEAVAAMMAAMATVTSYDCGNDMMVQTLFQALIP